MTLIRLAAVRRAGVLLAASAGLSLLAGCGGGGGGGGSSAPAAPSGGQPAGGTTPPVATSTVTISGNKVTPEVISVAMGAVVTFVNQGDRVHQMMSDPHPVHNDCPEVNVGTLSPGQSRQTSPLMVARACGFHDNLQDSNTALRGRILIAGAEDPGTRY